MECEKFWQYQSEKGACGICRLKRLQPYQFYIDDGSRDTNFERPQFKQMIEGAQKGMVKRIIGKDLSRFERDYIRVGLYTKFFFPDKNIHFTAVNDGAYSNIQKDSDFAPFKTLLNECYAKVANNRD